LAATLRELGPFATAARPTLNEARRSAPSLVRLARATTPVLRRLQPTAATLRQFTTSLDPVTGLLESSGPDMLGTLEGWARLTQVRDGLGHMFRNSFILPAAVVQNVRRDGRARGRRARTPRGLKAPTVPSRQPAQRPAVPK